MNKFYATVMLLLLFLVFTTQPMPAAGGRTGATPCVHCPGQASPEVTGQAPGAQNPGAQGSGCLGSCGGHCDMVCICRKSHVAEGEKVKDMVLILSEGTVKGEVTGGCVVLGGRLHLAKTARMEGDLVAIFSTIEKENGAAIHGNYVNIGTFETSGLPGFLKGVLSGWDILAALLLLLLFPRFAALSTDRLSASPVQSLMAGFLGIIGFIPVIALLTLSIVGIVIIPLVPLFYVTGFILGFAVIAMLMGNRLFSKSGAVSPLIRNLAGLIAIAAALYLLSLIPVLGPLVSELLRMCIRTAGLGLLIILAIDAGKKEKRVFP